MRRLMRYGATAGVAAVVDLGGFVLLQRGGMGLAPAAATSFLIATVVNYALSARFVFGAVPSLHGYGRFLLAAMLGFACNVAVTVLGVRTLGLIPVMAKLVGIGVAFLFNFALNAVFVFGRTGQGKG